MRASPQGSTQRASPQGSTRSMYARGATPFFSQRPWGVDLGVTCPRRPTLYFDAAGITVATLHASMTLFSEEGSQGAALD